MFKICLIFVLFFILTPSLAKAVKKKCFRRVHGSRTFVPEIDSSDDGNSVQPNAAPTDVGTTFRTANQDVYLWPTLSKREKSIIRGAFHQIHRRTCIRFNELDYKPWFHHERWAEGKPYAVIRKSKKFFGYSDNKIEGVNRRSLIYLSEKSLGPENPGNSSRGMVMEQMLKFMGFREEFLRPDSPSYIKPLPGSTRPSASVIPPKFSNEQLMWPFDPESITMPAMSRDWFKLTLYCQARHNSDIGAGQRAGVLTRWDAVKLNSMYCPKKVGYADPRMGPCVVPRKKLCKPGENCPVAPINKGNIPAAVKIAGIVNKDTVKAQQPVDKKNTVKNGAESEENENDANINLKERIKEFFDNNFFLSAK